jgi:glycosyltransferase involved in cell wall biosynthesis
VEVEVFGVGGSTAVAAEHHWHHEDEQFAHIMEPMYDAAVIPAAHLLASIDAIRRAGDFDIIHDHNNLLGPALMRDGVDLPPVLHTLHWPLKTDGLREGNIDASKFYNLLAGGRQLFFNCISTAQFKQTAMRLRSRITGVVHHGIDVRDYPFAPEKGDYFVTVGRVCAVKGTAIAARLAREMGVKFRIAGQVADSDIKYYEEQVLPLLVPGRVEFVGAASGPAKHELVGRAKAFLMPIQWDEPFGVAVIEALAYGTPVVAMRRGSMPEIIEHGVNGFLADSPEEFRGFMERVSEIDPAACRRSVQNRFSYQRMSRSYLELYETILARVKAPLPTSLKVLPPVMKRILK